MTTTGDRGGTAPEWYTANGRRHRGEVGEDADGVPFGAGDVRCATCKGTGVSQHGRGGRACRACGGERTTYQQFRVYDAEGLARFKATAAFRGAPKRRGRPRPAASGGKGPLRKSGGAPPRAAAAAKPGGRRPTATRARAPSRTVEAMRETYDEYRSSHAALFDRAEAVDNDFVRELLGKAREWGGLTEAQRLKLGEVVAGIERARAVHADSDYVGSLKQRFDVEVTCTEHRSFEARKVRGRGTNTIHVTNMVDAGGNVFMAVTPAFSLSPGDRARVTGTVRGHEERDGYRLTLLNRVVVLEHRPAPPGWAPEPWSPAAPPAPAPAPHAEGGTAGEPYEDDFEELAAPAFGS